jgi:hypothetical protein
MTNRWSGYSRARLTSLALFLGATPDLILHWGLSIQHLDPATSYS